ncbi:hypothetical protein BROUX41_002498 [Berkeleyomyces rouxiae]
MSADFLADLDDFYSKPAQANVPPPQNPPSSFSLFHSPVAASQDDADDDGWGDFEAADPVAQPTPIAASGPALLPSAKPPAPMRIVRCNTLDMMSSNLLDLDDAAPTLGPQVQSELPPWSRNAPAARAKPATSAPTWFQSSAPLKPVVESPVSQLSAMERAAVTKGDVLFDVDEFGDDEFGEFESVPQPAQAAVPKIQASLPSLDLLSLDLDLAPQAQAAPTPASSSASTPMAPSSLLMPSQNRPPNLTLAASFQMPSASSPMSPYPQAPKSPSFQDRNPYPCLSLKTPTQATFDIRQVNHEETADAKDHENKPSQATKQAEEDSPDPITAWPSGDAGSAHEEWPAFEDFPDDKTTAPKTASQDTAPGGSGHASYHWSPMDATAKVTQDQGKDNEPPPTNIPPPSVLLAILPGLLQVASTCLFEPLASLSSAAKKEVMEDRRTMDFLRGYLLIATVGARIMAGRKLRWHRDKFLSRGMSISAAGSKGMKLAGVDKAQAAREDREAADVVASWKALVGRLRSGVSAANAGAAAQSGAPLRVPEISDNMAVQTAKNVPGAPKACVLCGLKRDERIAKVDVEVEDSFGEWWVEFWGHRACKNFWTSHEGSLRSR